MKMEKINEIMKNGKKTTKRVMVADDPWWGKKYETRTYYTYEGKRYEYRTDRDGWPVMEKA